MELKEAYKFKEIEKKYEINLNRNKFTIIRLDGKKFHRYTKRFVRPFDIRISYSLIKAAEKIYSLFNRQFIFIYAQSDEVSLIYPNKEFCKYEDKTNFEIPYNGRVQKINSLITSAFTNEFNKTMMELKDKYYEIESVRIYRESLQQEATIKFNKYFIEKFKFKIPKLDIFENFTFAEFDCRIFQLESIDEVNEYLKWRRVDAIRNSKNSFGFNYFSHKKLEKLSSNEIINKVKNELNYNYSDLPSIYKVGIAIKTNDFTNFDFNNYFNNIEEFYDFIKLI